MSAPTIPTTPDAQTEQLAAERRRAPRYRCLRECLVRLEGASEPLDWPAMVYNLSVTGIGLALPFPALPGMVLLIEPRGRAASLRARVVRSRLLEYVWFHGCEFVERLGKDELRHWLAFPRGWNGLPPRQAGGRPVSPH